jgi:hypothetical protein
MTLSRSWAPYVWMGWGFGDFLDLREKIFFLKLEYSEAV